MEHITKHIIDGKIFYVKLTWKDNETDLFHIKVISTDNSWSGRFSQEFAAKYRDRVDETLEEYKENAKKALTDNTNEYTCHFINNPDDTISVTFSWKKRFQNKKPTVHGSVPIHLDDTPETANDLIDNLINVNNRLQGTVTNYSEKVEQLNEELKKCRSEMDKFISMKTSLEMSLYEKFVQLLNSKKRRIQLLEDSIVEKPGSELD